MKTLVASIINIKPEILPKPGILSKDTLDLVMSKVATIAMTGTTCVTMSVLAMLAPSTTSAYRLSVTIKIAGIHVR